MRKTRRRGLKPVARRTGVPDQARDSQEVSGRVLAGRWKATFAAIGGLLNRHGIGAEEPCVLGSVPRRTRSAGDEARHFGAELEGHRKVPVATGFSPRLNEWVADFALAGRGGAA